MESEKRDSQEIIRDLLTGIGCSGKNTEQGRSPQWLNSYALLRREDVARPTLFFGVGSDALEAGIEKIISLVKHWFLSRGLSESDVDFVQVGSLGIRAADPVVDIQLPGRRRISFQRVTEDFVPFLLSYFFILENGRLTPRSFEENLFDLSASTGTSFSAHLLFQYDGGTPPWKDVPLFSEHPFFAHQKRVLLSNCGRIAPSRISEAIVRGDYASFVQILRNRVTPEGGCAQVEKSGLKDLDGDCGSVGEKWLQVLKKAKKGSTLICNADDGDPGVYISRHFLESDPHRVIEGILIASYAIRANGAILYMRPDEKYAQTCFQNALDEARETHLLGESILGSDFSLDIEIKTSPGTLVGRIPSACIPYLEGETLEGKRAVPSASIGTPEKEGLFQFPTLIHTVETIVNLPELFRSGSTSSSSNGTGTKIFALSGKAIRAGLVEVPLGTSIRSVVYEIGGGALQKKGVKAVQVGGPFGGTVPETLFETPLDFENLPSVGAVLGSGSLVVMDEDHCMVDVAKTYLEFLVGESCGKCTPCREGLRRLYEILDRITSFDGNDSFCSIPRSEWIPLLEELAKTVRETSLCSVGRNAPNPVLSTLRYFRAEYETHIKERHCMAAACSRTD